jgi:hypothetical protein
MTARADPSPIVALIELRAHISAGVRISTRDAARLTEIVRGSFAAWSDAAENTNELTVILMQEKLEPYQRAYALQLLDWIEDAL